MRTNRYASPDRGVGANTVRSFFRSPLHLLAIMMLPMLASACIVVVEEDRDRHRHLHGSEWYLEVVFYRTQTVEAAEREVQVQFAENGTLTGQSDCGSFTGFYTTNENDGFDVTSVELSGSCSQNSTARLMAEGLRAATSYEADASSLRIRTADQGYLSFSTE